MPCVLPKSPFAELCLLRAPPTVFLLCTFGTSPHHQIWVWCPDEAPRRGRRSSRGGGGGGVAAGSGSGSESDGGGGGDEGSEGEGEEEGSGGSEADETGAAGELSSDLGPFWAGGGGSRQWLFVVKWRLWAVDFFCFTVASPPLPSNFEKDSHSLYPILIVPTASLLGPHRGAAWVRGRGQRRRGLARAALVRAGRARRALWGRSARGFWRPLRRGPRVVSAAHRPTPRQRVVSHLLAVAGPAAELDSLVKSAQGRPMGCVPK